MKISKTHAAFAKYTNINVSDNESIKNILGKNWKDILNFWIYVDSLSKSEKKKIHNRFRRINPLTEPLGFNTVDMFVLERYSDKLRNNKFSPDFWLIFSQIIISQSVLYATLELLSDRVEKRVLPLFKL